MRLFLVLASCLALSIGACTKKDEGALTSGSTDAKTQAARGDLKIEDQKEGTGAAATLGKEVTVHYTGWLTDGTQFDSSLGRQPITFRLGTEKIIQGWNKGIEGMKEGGKRKLTIPPDLAYGERGADPVIPPNATLIFEVELLKVE